MSQRCQNLLSAVFGLEAAKVQPSHTYFARLWLATQPIRLRGAASILEGERGAEKGAVRWEQHVELSA
jgi:hypothetical protein